MRPNFYLNENGEEQPIPYLAESLINVPAPNGYHWEQDLRVFNRACELFEAARTKAEEEAPRALSPIWLPSPPRPPHPIKYIAVKDKENNEPDEYTDKSTSEKIKQWWRKGEQLFKEE